MIFITKNKIKHILIIVFITQMLFLNGCSHSKSVTTGSTVEADNTSALNKVNVDRFEKLNRRIFIMNAGIDKYLFKPVAKGYKKITPELVDTSITNFFLNLGDIKNAANNLLQFKPGEALIDTERFLFNSTIGVAGLFDVATKLGMQKHTEDFGQTLAVWGVKPGPYIMLPLFGPSTLRDATAKFTLDSITNPINYNNDEFALFALEKLDKRADLLSTEEAFKDLSDDQYIALRDAWLQRRESLILDGKVNQEEKSNLIDELEDLDDD